MLDLIYVAISIAFFALMLGYVSVCQALGEREESKDQTP
jgi:hypothetical protein